MLTRCVPADCRKLDVIVEERSNSSPHPKMTFQLVAGKGYLNNKIHGYAYFLAPGRQYRAVN